MHRVSTLISLALSAVVVVAPRLAAEQLPPSDVTVADARSGSGPSLTVFTASYLGGESTTSVLVGVEVRLAKSVLPQNGLPRQLEITCLVDSGLSRVAERVVVVSLADGATVSTAIKEGVRVLTRVAVPAGHYALRVMARDSGDQRIGTVVHDLEVPKLLDASIAMSNLVMTSSAVGGVTHAEGQEEDRVLPILGRSPSGRRQFSRGEQVEVNAEIYEAPPQDDLVGELRITTRIVTPDGRVVYETSDTGQSETLPSGAYGYHHYTLVPISTLPPGLYAVRVTASVDGVMSISRSVPITVASSDSTSSRAK